ncbi:MAG: urate hydroxylase PuuD, partial [Microgenomates group bacterium]
MYDWVVLWDWVEIAVRWLHVTTAIAWIGSSFYFIALDLGLRKTPSLPPLAHGEEWQVHGGGFYHIQKHLVAPEMMPDHLTWFKWESYATWLSGFAMLTLVYYLGSDLYLIDPAIADLTQWQAIGISVASLALGWVLYTALCKAPVGRSTGLLALVLFAMLLAFAWGYTHLF